MEAYPIQRMDDCLDSLGGAVLFSFILSSAQVPVFGSKHQGVPVNLYLIIDFLKFRLCLSWGKYCVSMSRFTVWILANRS